MTNKNVQMNHVKHYKLGLSKMPPKYHAPVVVNAAIQKHTLLESVYVFLIELMKLIICCRNMQFIKHIWEFVSLPNTKYFFTQLET